MADWNIKENIVSHYTMFGAYLRILLGVFLAFFIVAALLTLGFVVLLILTAVIGAVLLWYRIRVALGFSPPPVEAQIIETEYRVIEAKEEDK